MGRPQKPAIRWLEISPAAIYRPLYCGLFCLEQNLIIEVDGGYHDVVYEADCTRQQFLESRGYRVIRFANEDVLADVEAVAVAIRRAILQITENEGAD